jgi:hypothetical protein
MLLQRCLTTSLIRLVLSKSNHVVVQLDIAHVRAVYRLEKFRSRKKRTAYLTQGK